MGGMLFDPQVLGDTLSETCGYKSGLALSLEAMCDHLASTDYADILVASETRMVRLRSEDYEDLFYKLLHAIGYTEEEYDGDITGIGLYHKYRGTELEQVYLGVVQLFTEIWPKIMDDAIKNGKTSLDTSPYFEEVAKKYGKVGLQLALEKIQSINKGMNLSPHSVFRYTEWVNVEDLDGLFTGKAGKPEYGKFLDQRFINYLNANSDRVGDIHWRKFEELTAEFFEREGFNVELGPGSNDDGIDVRVWEKTQDPTTEAPHLIIQCKRQKSKIEKVVVKGLYADVMFQEASYGLIVTSSELSPGARETISVRGYPIKEVNNQGVRDWLKALRVPGSGIVRV